MENVRRGTSIAELSPPTKMNSSGCCSASFTAPKPPIEMPTIARFQRPGATGNFILYLRDEILHDIVFVAILRRIGCIGVVRCAPLRHQGLRDIAVAMIALAGTSRPHNQALSWRPA